MQNVLITSKEFGKNIWPELEQLLKNNHYQPIFNPKDKAMSAQEICQIVNEHNISAILVYSSSDEMNHSVFENCPSLKIVSRHGVGVENIDLVAAEQFGVAVKTTLACEDYEAVADLAFGFMLSLARRIPESDRALRNNQWVRLTSTNLWRKTVGLIGFGRIGRAVAKRANGFDMNVLVYDPYINSADVTQQGIVVCSKEQLLQESDFISLHCRLTEETREMIGAKEFELMKPTAMLVNTARAGLVHQDSLIHALQQLQIAGAAVDVYNNEPAINDPLVQTNLNNLVVTPHIASYTQEVLLQMDRLAVLNIIGNGE